MARFSHSPGRFLAHERGVAAVEFSLLAPLMLALMAGIISFGEGLRQYRHAFQTAASLAQTAARYSVANAAASTQITSDQSAALTNGVNVLLGSQNVSSLTATAQRVVMAPGGQMNVVWTWTTPGATAAAIVPSEISAFASSGESVVVVDVSFSRSYLFGLIGGTYTSTAHYCAGVPGY